jgi:MmgE/PrpD C-terminal domain
MHHRTEPGGGESTGGGRFGPKTDVYTKEDADHSLPYLPAVAALDGDVQPAQLEPGRIERPDVQGLLRRVEVRADDRLSARYPGEFPSRVMVRLRGGRSYNHEVKPRAPSSSATAGAGRAAPSARPPPRAPGRPARRRARALDIGRRATASRP